MQPPHHRARRDAEARGDLADLDEPWLTAQQRAGTIASALVVADSLDVDVLAVIRTAWDATFPEEHLRAVV
jgi:hypothetical protein